MSKERPEISTKRDCWYAWYAYITGQKNQCKGKTMLRKKNVFFLKYRPFAKNKKCNIVSRWHFIPPKNVDGKKEIWVVGIFVFLVKRRHGTLNNSRLMWKSTIPDLDNSILFHCWNQEPTFVLKKVSLDMV